jgi:hypothetical protein
MRGRHIVGVTAVGAAAAAVILLARRWYLVWGATGQEVASPSPVMTSSPTLISQQPAP